MLHRLTHYNVSRECFTAVPIMFHGIVSQECFTRMFHGYRRYANMGGGGGALMLLLWEPLKHTKKRIKESK